jgi:hypothetical protein
LNALTGRAIASPRSPCGLRKNREAFVAVEKPEQQERSRNQGGALVESGLASIAWRDTHHQNVLSAAYAATNPTEENPRQDEKGQDEEGDPTKQPAANVK